MVSIKKLTLAIAAAAMLVAAALANRENSRDSFQNQAVDRLTQSARGFAAETSPAKTETLGKNEAAHQIGHPTRSISKTASTGQIDDGLSQLHNRFAPIITRSISKDQHDEASFSFNNSHQEIENIASRKLIDDEPPGRRRTFGSDRHGRHGIEEKSVSMLASHLRKDAISTGGVYDNEGTMISKSSDGFFVVNNITLKVSLALRHQRPFLVRK